MVCRTLRETGSYTESTRTKLEIIGGYHVLCRGEVELKGKGLAKTYWLTGKEGFTKPLPVPPEIGLSSILNSGGNCHKVEAPAAPILVSTNPTNAVTVQRTITPNGSKNNSKGMKGQTANRI
ncbi:Retinal guanylyl cyclase 2 [Lamellibrachia satsuma]|nr:Retinal guanylyl cyclase 2 [Lamellibrachia satsuma]